MATTPKPLHPADQFYAVSDEKLRLTLGVIADKYDEATRELIYRTYQDDHLAMVYRRIRASGVYDKGGKFNKKIIEFPNVHVLNFCETVLSAMYGPDWLNDHRAVRHELVRPWWVVSKI